MTLLNLALPFILRAIYIYAKRVIHKRKKTEVIDPPPAYTFPVLKLLILGVALCFLFLGLNRIFLLEPDAPFVGNQSKTEVYK